MHRTARPDAIRVRVALPLRAELEQAAKDDPLLYSHR
jgi:hypothetical protein